MKQNFYKISSSNKFQAVIAFLRKELHWKTSDALVSLQNLVRGNRGTNASWQFLYINSSFSPAPDDVVANLFKVNPSQIFSLFPVTYETHTESVSQCFQTENHLVVNYR